MALAAFGFLLKPHKVIADPDTQIGGVADPTRTLKMDSNSKQWDETVKLLLEQRDAQRKQAEDKRLAEERAKEEARQQAIIAARVAPSPQYVPPVGNHTDLMAAVGINPADYGYVEFIVSHESGWRPLAQNPSGAYGLCQSLPASKMASAGADYLTNPQTQLRWCNGYAVSRYGGWANAYAFWLSHHWW